MYKYGDVLSLRGKIVIPEKLGNPYEFDYKKYLNSKNIVAQISTYDVEVVDVKKSNIFLKIIYSFKDRVSYRIDSIMPEIESNLFKSMLYGDDKFLDEDIKEDFEKSGLSHLLAVSGSNLAMIMMIILYISKKMNKNISVIFVVIIGYILCAFCSFEMSILRASIFLVISTSFKNKEKSLNTYLKIFLSFLCIVIYNPYSVFNIGMIMSYLAVISMVMFQSKILSFLDIRLKTILGIKYVKPKKFKKVIYNIVYTIILSLSFTLSVQILLFPIQIYFFNSFTLISFLSNLVISYIDNIFAIIGYTTILLSFIPYISNILLNTTYILLRVIIYISKFCASLDILNISLATPNILSLIIYYICILLLNNKKYVILYVKKSLRKIVYLCIKICYLLSIIYIFTSYIYLNYFNNYVIFFNVEQGNMALIHYNNLNVIFDIGSTKENLASNIIINYLKKKNITKIDAVVLSHFHTDHINGINEKLLDEVKIEKVIYARPKEKQEEYDTLMSCINKRNISKIEVTKGENIQIGNMNIYFVSPDVNKKIEADDIANANSLVSFVTVKNKKILFMGDATKETEEYILNKNINDLNSIDFYQVGHHGSKTSSKDEFISKLNINTAIISAKKKVYNHPSEETLNTLFNHNISVKITEKDGAVKFNI